MHISGDYKNEIVKEETCKAMKKGIQYEISHILILYQRVTGDLYTIISEGKFTLNYGKEASKCVILFIKG